MGGNCCSVGKHTPSITLWMNAITQNVCYVGKSRKPHLDMCGIYTGQCRLTAGAFYPEWIGSYVSCTGTPVLEHAVQGARHIRCIVLRSSTDGGGLLQGKSTKSGMAQFVQYGDCIRTLLPRSERTPLHATRQWRYEAGAPRPASCPTRHTSASPPI